jgi:antitoxin CcdA
MRIQCALRYPKGISMRTSPSASRSTHKRAVNLTLSEALVDQTKLYSSNLSATVEILLTNYVSEQSKISQQKIQTAQRQSTQWNLINAQLGSFADEYSNL